MASSSESQEERKPRTVASLTRPTTAYNYVGFQCAGTATITGQPIFQSLIEISGIRQFLIGEFSNTNSSFCRNSAMTSFAGNRSWNLCGRPGVNSATALRTAVGSDEDIGGGNNPDTDRETCWRRYGNQNARARTIRCQPRVTANSRLRRVHGRGPFETEHCLRTGCVNCQCLVPDC